MKRNQVAVNFKGLRPIIDAEAERLNVDFACIVRMWLSEYCEIKGVKIKT